MHAHILLFIPSLSVGFLFPSICCRKSPFVPVPTCKETDRDKLIGRLILMNLAMVAENTLHQVRTLYL
jgi:hypothetical protein